jgi:hypothetical protein
MASEYWKSGTTAYIYFSVWDSGAGKTGLSDADFTKNIWKNGSTAVATTGVTISEVDSTDAPGRYVATVNGSTGFAATPGQYQVQLHWSSQNPRDGAHVAITVTNDGTGSGSWGDSLFSASIGDGRVTDGASAIEDATVYVYDSSSTLLYRTSTDASGLWSVTFADDGTYTIQVQKASYSIASDTIVVSGGTVTGPGSDITLSALGGSTGYTLSKLRAYALRQWYDKSDAQAETMAEEAVNEALRFCATSRDWPWYNRMVTVDFEPPYNTGSISITSGTKTVTLSGGTFPTWAANGVIIVSNQVFEVASRDSATQVTLADEYNGANLSASSYVIAQFSYDLPSPGLYNIDYITGGTDWPWSLQPISYAAWANLRNTFPSGQSPMHWTIWKGKLAVWPFYSGSNAKRFNLYAKTKPAELTADTDEADWDSSLPDLLYRAIDLHISYRGSCRAGDTQVCRQNWQDAMDRATGNDLSANNIDMNRRAAGASHGDIDMATRTVT